LGEWGVESSVIANSNRTLAIVNFYYAAVVLITLGFAIYARSLMKFQASPNIPTILAERLLAK
jgi:sulfite exporter TauE/SafE